MTWDPVRPVLLTGGRLLDPDGELDNPPIGDLLVENGRILAVGHDATERSVRLPDLQMVDVRGMLVSPGFINAHYHSHDVLLRGAFEQQPLDAWGLYAFPGAYSQRSPREVRLRTALGAVESLRCGITTVQDMVTFANTERPHIEQLVATYRDIGIRAVVAIQFSDRATADTIPFARDLLSPEVLSRLPGASDFSVIQRLIEELLEQAAPGRVTWALGPSAPQRCSEELLRWVASAAERHSTQVFTHVYETRQQAILARRAYERDGGSFIGLLGRLGLLSGRLTIAHGVWITDEEIAAVGRAGANLAFNPMSNLKLLNGVAPVRRYADAGANVAAGCDNCSGNDSQNIFETMKMFALYWGLQSKSGEAGAAREAFRAATLGGG